jgi:phosphoribosylformylglycinamidine (FGAM) synthase-like enzyme
VAPFPGAETGAGGRIRDTHATGIGSLVGAATAGYCVGNLQVPCSLQQYEKEIPCVMCKLNSWLLVYWRILDGRNVISRECQGEVENISVSSLLKALLHLLTCLTNV